MLRPVSSLLGVCALAAGLIGGAAPALAQASPTGTWAAESSGDYFYYGTSCTDGTYMYVLGGYQQIGNTTHEQYARFRRYDPVANAWINMPLIASGTTAGSTVWGYQYPGAAAFHSNNGTNRIFMFGGYVMSGPLGTASTSYTTTNQIRMFTFASATTGTWTTLGSTLSQVSYYNACAAMDDRIYVAGGASITMLNIFNPIDQSVQTNATSMPGYLYYHGMAAVPSLGKIYAMGGYGTAGYTGINYEYTPEDTDPTTNDTGGTWATRAQISNGTTVQPLYLGVGLINLNNRIYVIGYNSSTAVYNQMFEYNPITNTWVQRANLTYGGYYWPAWVAINGKGYFYGGAVYPTTGEEYTPPNFGSPPNLPTNVGQVGSQSASSLQALADDSQVNGWTNSQVAFTANVTDPDANQQVRFRVQVKPTSAAQWTSAQVVNLQTALGAQGVKTLSWTIPANGSYDWRWRVEDTFGNSYPVQANVWVDAFGTVAAPNTTSPDFRSDQITPTDPVGLAPSDLDFQVPDPNVGSVTLSWLEATDNGPVSGISYELQVARDGGFNDIEAQIFSTAGTSSYPVSLSVSRFEKYWRIRARDVGGNFSLWSPPLRFRVTFNDGEDHGSGDAEKSCGFAAAGLPVLPAALMGLILLAAGRRVSRRNQ
jgi:hypothetical protein